MRFKDREYAYFMDVFTNLNEEEELAAAFQGENSVDNINLGNKTTMYGPISVPFSAPNMSEALHSHSEEQQMFN